MSYRHSALILGFLPLLVAGPVCAQVLYPKPAKVLGDPNFIGTVANPLALETQAANVVEGRELQTPEGVAIDNSVSPPLVYIADTANNRVLMYQYNTQLTAGSFADNVLGQLNRFSTIGASQGVSTALKTPTGMVVDSAGNLYVADTGNNRILRYPTPASQPAGYQLPNLVIGQTSYAGTGANTGGVTAKTLSLFSGSFAGRTGLAIDSGGNLWVADTGNNRVMRFPVAVLQAGQPGPAADIVVGQMDLVSSVAASARNSKTGMTRPNGIALDAAARLLVADQLGRVLVYPAGAGPGTAAIRILGIDTSQNGGNNPTAIAVGGNSATVEGVSVAGSNIIVSDNNNNRVLVFGSVDTWPPESTQFSPSAIQVLGQANFTSALANGGNVDSSAVLMSSPTDAGSSASELWVADSGNNRILVFPIAAKGVTTVASRVIGQLDFPYNAPNLVEGKEFATTSGPAFGGSAVLDLSVSPPHLYVADTQNNRILGFTNFATVQPGQKADIVIGQPDMFRVGVNYPGGVSTQPNATGLYNPIGLAVDPSGNLYVADTGNARVVRFPAPFASGSTAGQSADMVIGQASLTGRLTDATQSTMASPIALAFTSAASGYLVVSDVTQNRVLLFKAPLSSGMSASIVLGQTSFTSSVGGTGGAGFTSPGGVAVDSSDRILVADAGNGRVQAFPTVSSLGTTSTPASFSITSGLSQPVSIGMTATSDFWVADSNANLVLHFASIDQLPVANPPYASDTTQPAVSPRSAFVDQYNNLLITDGVNRVEYDVPQVNVLNAANYIVGRAVAAGTIVSLFPAVAANPLSSGVETNTVIPVSTNLSDTEVLLNGTPSALFYVSPTQINLPLSYGLPAGGIANIQVIRPSTGQIYGAAEIALSSASPGLFVAGGLQSGPASAENQDFSINSASNPAPRGTILQVYATGQGAVTGAPADGNPSSGLVPTVNTPQILLGSASTGIFVPASNIQYSGLAPGGVGLWQINFTIPSNAPTGNVPITVFMNSISSSNTALPTQVVPTVSIK